MLNGLADLGDNTALFAIVPHKTELFEELGNKGHSALLNFLCEFGALLDKLEHGNNNTRS
jgi:hypothetical protein